MKEREREREKEGKGQIKRTQFVATTGYWLSFSLLLSITRFSIVCACYFSSTTPCLLCTCEIPLPLFFSHPPAHWGMHRHAWHRCKEKERERERREGRKRRCLLFRVSCHRERRSRQKSRRNARKAERQSDGIIHGPASCFRSSSNEISMRAKARGGKQITARNG